MQFSEHNSLPDEVQVKDTMPRPTVLSTFKESVALDSHLAACSPTSTSDTASVTVSLNDVRRHVSCAICNNLIASSLVLSCGHQYCGSCLFDWLSNKPSCPNCQVPLRAIPTRCIALDGVIEAFLPSLPDHEVAAFKARQEEGKSAANKVNKMFWWLQPSAVPGVPGNPPGFAGNQGAGMGASGMGNLAKQPSFPSAQPQQAMMGAGLMGGAYQQAKPLPPAGGHARRASNPGSSQPGFPPRPSGRSNSFSAGGAHPSGFLGQQHPGVLPPQMAASIAAAGFATPSLAMSATGSDLEAAYLATAQKFGMDGLALPLVYQQQLAMTQLQQQQQQLLSELSAVDLSASPPQHATGYTDPHQLQQLLQGLYFA